MKFTFNLSLLSIIYSSLFFFGSCQTAYCAREKGWILTQRSKIFGDQYLYITTHGVKCLNPKQGIGWVTQGPNWNITFFNEKTALYYPLSAASWKKKLTQNAVIPSNITWAKVSSGSIAGLKASEYKMTNNAFNKAAQTGNGSRWLSATYWLADNINVPANLSQLVSAAAGLPATDSVPLQLIYRNQKGQTETLLSTYHQSTCAIPDSYFVAPSNYKVARSEVEILMTQENRSLLNDLANDLTHDNSVNHQSTSATASKQTVDLSVNKLPDQLTLPGGKTVTKEQVNNFLNKLKQNR